MREILKFITGRIFITCTLLVLQICFVIYLMYYLSSYSMYIHLLLSILSVIITFIIVNKNDNPMFKLSWVIMILVFPVFGWFLYIIFEKRVLFGLHRKFNGTFDFCEFHGEQNTETAECLKSVPDVYSQVKYIYNSASAAVYDGTETDFYSCGEDFYKSFVSKLNNAKRFIFFEYFIINSGRMWSEVYALLREKARNGVEIRILFDDMGCGMFDKSFRAVLKKERIFTAAFNPLRPSLDAFINYRDHRKITIIDGTTAFTGGINISDEYVNMKERFGYWKDCALMLRGKAVSAMTDMFVEMWNFCSPDTMERKKYNCCANNSCKNDGFVQPFGDKPDDAWLTGEMAYIKIINSAVKYIYITTPYLVPDNEMITALCLAAGSGVDVRIMTPFVPDKWYIQTVTRSNYKVLINAGIRIYEFLPGFIHSKTIVSDDTKGIAGTSNFDFRSFYLLFENGVFMYDSSAVVQMKRDFEATLIQCREIKKPDYGSFSSVVRVSGAILKLFSPLM